VMILHMHPGTPAPRPDFRPDGAPRPPECGSLRVVTHT
jgi:hypothetical protein